MKATTMETQQTKQNTTQWNIEKMYFDATINSSFYNRQEINLRHGIIVIVVRWQWLLLVRD